MEEDLKVLDGIIARVTDERELEVLKMLRDFIDDEEHVLYMDARTGRFVSKEYAKANPETTMARTIV